MVTRGVFVSYSNRDMTYSYETKVGAHSWGDIFVSICFMKYISIHNCFCVRSSSTLQRNDKTVNELATVIPRAREPRIR